MERGIDCVHPYTARRMSTWRDKLTSSIPKPLAAGALATIKKKRKLAALFFLCVYANSSKLGLASTQKKRTPIGYSFSFLMVAEREGFFVSFRYIRLTYWESTLWKNCLTMCCSSILTLIYYLSANVSKLFETTKYFGKKKILPPSNYRTRLIA